MFLTGTKKMLGDRIFLQKAVRIALPVAMQGMLNTIVNLVDTMMIGTLGETTIAAVGLANKVFFVFSLLVFGIVSGSGVLAAQYWGNNDVKNIRKVLGLALMLALAGAAHIWWWQPYPIRLRLSPTFMWPCSGPWVR